MRIGNVMAKGVLGLALAAVGYVQAGAQNVAPVSANLSLRRSSQRDTWQTVMLVSAIVGIVGLVQDDSTLTLLGGAGVLLSLYESDRTRFQFGHGVDLVKTGPVSLGFSPFGPVWRPAGFAERRPTAYMQFTVRF